MDGYQLAAQVRETLKADAPRLIALTGYGQDSDHQRSQAAGFDRHLVKPVPMRRLLDAIADLQRR
jgi:CheY-like chemotaxis protein